MPAAILLRQNSVAGTVPTTSNLQAGELAVNVVDGKLYAYRNNGAASVIQVNPVSSNAEMTWQPVAGLAPQDTYEFDDRAILFSQGSGQSATMIVRVPSTYLTGSQIILKLGHYSPGTSNNFKLHTVTNLIRKNTDAVNSTTNQYTSTNGDQALATPANKYFEISYDVTDSTGKINSVVVSPGDLIKIVLTRVTPTGTEDTNDVRVLPGSTEVRFS